MSCMKIQGSKEGTTARFDGAVTHYSGAGTGRTGKFAKETYGLVGLRLAATFATSSGPS
jgi:hypothetical protein